MKYIANNGSGIVYLEDNNIISIVIYYIQCKFEKPAIFEKLEYSAVQNIISDTFYEEKRILDNINNRSTNVFVTYHSSIDSLILKKVIRKRNYDKIVMITLSAIGASLLLPTQTTAFFVIRKFTTNCM